MSKLSINDLIDRMKGISDSRNTTNGWGMLCSYGMEPLNKSLAKEHSNQLGAKPIKFTVTQTHLSGEKEEGNFILNLEAPTIRFGIYNGNGEGTITFPIAATSQCNVDISDGKGGTSTKDIYPKKSQYYITANALLGGVPSTTDDKDITGAVSGASTIIKMEDKSIKVAITVKFNTDRSMVKIISDPKEKDQVVPKADQAVLSLLRDSIGGENPPTEFKQLAYKIVHVIPYTAGETVLTPKSFIFSTQQSVDSSDKDGGALNIWIETDQYGKQGEAHPLFKPQEHEISPIPQGHNSNIIFSKELIQHYLSDTLGKTYTVSFPTHDLHDQVITSGIGIMLTLKNSRTATTEGYSEKWKMGGNDYSLTCTPLKIDYADIPVFLHLNQDKVGIQLLWNQTVSMTYNGETFAHKGDVQITAHINTTINLKDVSEASSSSWHVKIKIDNNMVQCDLKGVDNDYDNVVDAVKCFGDRCRNWARDNITSYLESVEIDLGTLNYFAEANILFNGQKFKAYTGLTVAEVTAMAKATAAAEATSLLNEQKYTGIGVGIGAVEATSLLNETGFNVPGDLCIIGDIVI